MNKYIFIFTPDGECYDDGCEIFEANSMNDAQNIIKERIRKDNGFEYWSNKYGDEIFIYELGEYFSLNLNKIRKENEKIHLKEEQIKKEEREFKKYQELKKKYE